LTKYRGSVGASRLQPKKFRMATVAPEVPEWARSAAPAEPRPPRPLAPSQLTEEREPAPLPTEQTRLAARRGTFIHQLLERLVDVAPTHRYERALAWLEKSTGVADAAQRVEIADRVCEVLSDQRFARLFAEGSLGEAPLAATLPDGRVIAGTADRLVIEESRVSVLDFKTGRVPDGPDRIPTAHRAQMEAYVAALGVIFPGHEVRAALLYTNGPRLFEL
jgi:ATP-dependent helicase/nuclease subunit A